MFANIRTFGASGDGVTDDLGAIQSAVDSLRNHGGVVYIPASSMCYMVSGQINLLSDDYANITIQGDGYASCIKLMPSGSTPLGVIAFRGNSTYSLSNVGLISVRISGQDETTPGHPLIYFGNSSRTFLRNSFLDTNRYEGAYWNAAADSQGATVDGNYATRIGGWSGSSNDVRAAYYLNVQDAILTTSRAYQVGQFVEQSGNDAVIRNNIFEDSGYNSGLSPGTGILCEGASAAAYGRVSVSNNIIRHSQTGVRFAANSGNNVISGNICSRCDSGVSYTGGNVAITGNSFSDTIAGSQGSAIALNTGTAAALIANNTFEQGSTPWAYLINIGDPAASVRVDGNRSLGSSWTIVAMMAHPNNTAVSFSNNTFISPLASGLSRYQFAGANFTADAYSGIDSGSTIISASAPKYIIGSGPPLGGTWAPGDTIINAAPISGQFYGFVNSGGGTPGTWVGFGLIP